MTGEQTPEHDWLAMLRTLELSQALTRRDDEDSERTRRLLKDFLEVLDSLDRIIRLDDSGVTGSLESLRRQLLGVFERAGVSFFESVDELFDPDRHEAVEVRTDPSAGSGVVLEEIGRGCTWNGTLLRTASVVVSEA